MVQDAAAIADFGGVEDHRAKVPAVRLDLQAEFLARVGGRINELWSNGIQRIHEEGEMIELFFGETARLMGVSIVVLGAVAAWYFTVANKRGAAAVDANAAALPHVPAGVGPNCPRRHAGTHNAGNQAHAMPSQLAPH